MKQLFSYSILKACLLMAALLMTINAAAYDFQVDGIQYTTTSDSTVEVISYWKYEFSSPIDFSFDVTIPAYVTYDDVTYKVTSIGDNALYFDDVGGFYCCITLPETITSIGVNAAANFNLINVICLASTPPTMNNSFIAEEINLFVLPNAYPLYKELNDQNHIFSSIYITDGERSELTTESICIEYPDNISLFEPYTSYPGGDWLSSPYGFAVKLISNENSTIFSRSVWSDYEDIWFGNNTYFYFENIGSTPKRYIVQAYAIEDGKSPSLLTQAEPDSYDLYPKWEMSFDFKESGIAYLNYKNEIGVTYCEYYAPWGQKNDNHFNQKLFNIVDKKSNISYENPNIYATAVGFGFLYAGDIIIPSSAIYHNYENDSYTSCLVTSITPRAFSLKDYYGNNEDSIINNFLTSVTMPGSITSVEEYAFGDCPNLSFIKCKGAVPPSAYDNSFDDGVYQNTTLYVPRDAVEAYRNATGWKNFQNIVGHYDFDYDFEVDGIYYAIVGDDVVVTHGEKAYQGVVNIPDEVTHEGVTYDVAGISDGAFADATVQHLILPVTIGTVGESAFAGSHIGSLVITGNGAWNAGAINCEVDNLYVMSGVTGIAGLQVNPSATVYSYSTVPPTCASGSFTGYDAALHVPASALAAYFTAPYWNYFINITSDAVEPTGLTINNDSVTVLVGNQLSLNATAAPANTTPADAILWTSSNDSIATVANGVITAVKVGECDIKAVLLDRIAVCHVTVTEIAPTSLTVSPDFAKLETGSQITLTATVLPEEATDKVVTWSSSNTAVATVNSEGIVTAVAPGECDVTATCRDIHATCHIIVVDHFIYITLDEHYVRLLPNHMLTLTPSVIPEGTSLVVTSTNPDVAAARMANGKIQVVGIKEGTTIVKVNSTDGYAEADSCIVKVYTMRGDVNCDGFVNIGDVTSLINYLLSHNANGIDVVNADANNDSNVNISDVTRLINHILSGDELDPKDEPEEDGLTFTVNGVTFTMVAVEGGTFTMGATAEQGDDALDAEIPAHQVTLSGYAIGQTEVTQALWEAVMGNNPSRFTGRPDCPVESVSWDDCQAFITQLNALTGKRFRLPTEAEWEFAARGGNKSQHYKYAGSDDLDEVAWYHDNAYGIGANGTRAVGTKKANELGIYDMSGNVWEWCQDIYDSYGSQPQTNPTGPDSGTNRTRRGGAWDQGTVSCRVSHRSNRASSYKFNNQGLRLAL